MRSSLRHCAEPTAPRTPSSHLMGNGWGFFADGKLRKVPLGGGTVVPLCDAPDGRGGSWASNDTIYFTPIGSGGTVFAVSASGGVPRSVAEVDVGDRWRWPDVLPGGRGLLLNGILPGGGRSPSPGGFRDTSTAGARQFRPFRADGPRCFRPRPIALERAV